MAALVTGLHVRALMTGPGADLQLTGDPVEPRTSRRLDRLTLAVLLLIMTATAAGLFGDGPLSESRALTPAARAQVVYERFARFGATIRTTVHLAPGDSSASIILAAEYLHSIQIESIVPEPVAARAVPEGVEYVFAQKAGAPLTIHLDIHAIRRGIIDAALATGGERVAWRHFIYP